MKAIILEGDPPDMRECRVLSGGDSSNPTWLEYLAGFEEAFRPCLVAMRAALRAKYGKRKTDYPCAEQICNDNHFAFDDPAVPPVAFTWRAWGDFVQAIVGEREGYMRYYMRP